MPSGTRVDRCYQKLKGKKGKSAAAAICQKSTGQSLATGKKLNSAADGLMTMARKRRMQHGG